MSSPLDLVIETTALRKALSFANFRAPGDKILPILSHVLISAESDGRARFTGTDMQLRTEASAPAVSVAGLAVVPGKALADLAARFPEGSQVEISVSGDVANVKCGRGRAKLRVLDARDFPAAFICESGATRIEIAGSEIAGMLERVLYAVSTEATRYYLCGVQFEVCSDNGAERLRAVACDGVRLDWQEAAAGKIAAGTTRSAILPTASAQAFAKAAAATDGDVTLAFDARRATLEAGATTLASQLIDGAYPDYRRIAPSREKHRFLATVDREALGRAIDAALTVATDNGRGVRIAVAERSLTIDRQRDRAEIEIGVEAEATFSEGVEEPYRFGVNGQFLRQSLNAIGGDTIDLRFLDSNVLHLARHSAADDGSSYTIVMPMRLDAGSLKEGAQ